MTSSLVQRLESIHCILYSPSDDYLVTYSCYGAALDDDGFCAESDEHILLWTRQHYIPQADVVLQMAKLVRQTTASRMG